MITVAQIREAVCREFSLPVEWLTQPTRRWDISHPRQVAMYLARELTPHSYTRIGQFLGGLDHSTVVVGINAVKRRKASDPKLAESIHNLTHRLAPSATVNSMEEAA